jgi:hypothetical protein
MNIMGKNEVFMSWRKQGRNNNVHALTEKKKKSGEVQKKLNGYGLRLGLRFRV